MPGSFGVRRPSAAATALWIVTVFIIQPSLLLGQRAASITVNITHPTNRFRPAHALGAGVDGQEKGVIDLQLTPANIRMMRSAGLNSLTYRLRTELGNDVWHWNPRGSWSDAPNRQGYWTSSDQLGAPVSLSYGYSLPRRGNTIDQAANLGYSRIDDGDTETFWKSNPYLARQFTGEDDALHSQWIVVEFENPEPINAVKIFWGEPFAKKYRIEYGNFEDVSDIALNNPGTWKTFPTGAIVNIRGRETFHRLARTPINARWLRILMIESSGTSNAKTNDVRDRLGFAMRELQAGVVDENGNFRDRIRHGRTRQTQTIIHVSSTDPWHRESDVDDHLEQVGLDRIYQNGLTNGLPMLLATGLLYDTPENSANEIRYLRARGYKFDATELGEEPDGQYITPEDFGALYLQWADAIHRVDRNLKLGGPSFQEILADPDAEVAHRGNSEWLRRFFDYLKRRGRASDYTFFSFEWYPFDNVCEPVAPQLMRAPRMLADSLRQMEREGLSREIPWIISEYGYSAFGARAELTIEGALLNADIVAQFLTLGGAQAFLFGYTPAYVDRDFACTAGNNMLFSLGDDGIKDRFATYFGARLVTHEWLQPGNEIHEVYRAASDARDASGNEVITAYAVHRPDGLWSVLVINKDPKRVYKTSLVFRNDQATSGFAGPVDLHQFSSKQYALGGTLTEPAPTKANQPEHRVLQARRKTTPTVPIFLPPYSLTVVRGALSSPK